MRSLTVKLTLAFLLVVVAAVGLLAGVVHYYTQRQFNQLVLDQNQRVLVANLSSYYETNGGWAGVDDVFRLDVPALNPPDSAGSRLDARRKLFLLADASGEIIVGDNLRHRTETLSPAELKRGIPIEAGSRTVGYLLFTPALDRWSPGTPEGNFLIGVQNAILLSAVAAGVIAVLFGGFLAYSMTKSLRELTTATEALSRGELGRQVTVHGEDEFGVLARAFNRMSADLARSIELRRKMTADIAHDLRTPLSVILGYSEALTDGKLPADPDKLEVIHTEAQHLSRLIDDLKVLALADAGELPLNLQPLEPGRLLSRAADAYHVEAEKKGVALVTEIAPDLPQITVDADRMAQVLGNLMSNALRFTPAGGTITLSAIRQDGEVQLGVADTGEGIHPDDLPMVFERNFRGDRARPAQKGESGIGLSIVKSLVEAQGGTVSVESVPGEGSIFCCRFPVNL